MTAPSSARWVWLGRIAWERAATLQERLREAVLRGEGPETLLLCEHDPVVTLGRHARPEHLLVSRSELERRQISVQQASRGGDVTYHGPGQLVGYPIFRLRRGLVGHLEAMAGGICSVLKDLGIIGQWRRERPGVWVGPDKICAFGVHVRHRVAIHGFALNASTPADAFSPIIPCGLGDAGVTSIERLRGHSPSLAELARATAAAFAVSFGLDLRAARDPDPNADPDPETDPHLRSEPPRG
jgi:lipoyl(octanoyl) transferase